MSIINLDEEIPIKADSGEVEVIKIGDLIHKKLKEVYLEAAYIDVLPGKDISYDIQRLADEIADIIGIPKVELTEEEWADIW